jgi:hypothetical protein
MLKRFASPLAAFAIFALAPASFAADDAYVPERVVLQQTDVPGSNYSSRAIIIMASKSPMCSRARRISSSTERARIT